MLQWGKEGCREKRWGKALFSSSGKRNGEVEESFSGERGSHITRALTHIRTNPCICVRVVRDNNKKKVSKENRGVVAVYEGNLICIICMSNEAGGQEGKICESVLGSVRFAK